jgi:hypothetical protein
MWLREALSNDIAETRGYFDGEPRNHYQRD